MSANTRHSCRIFIVTGIKLQSTGLQPDSKAAVIVIGQFVISVCDIECHLTALFLIVIVIVNSRFLERPQKRSRRNQLTHRRFTKTKSIGSGQDPESQSGRQSDRRLWWMVLEVETGRQG